MPWDDPEGWDGEEGGRSGWGTHVHPWQIHVNVWQNPLQYCKLISLQLNKKPQKLKRQKNTAQMKEQTGSTDVQVTEEEISKLPEKKFGIMMVKMIKNLENRMDKMQESINKRSTRIKE